MRVLLVAPPGAGKGTQAEKLARRYGVTHLSSGDLLRQEVRTGTAIGNEAAAFLARGDLVPDELILTMLTGPVLEASRHGGYVLDGFPRNLAQAEAAFDLTQQLDGIALEAVVHLQVARTELTRRLLARAARDGRSDDTEEVIAHRFDVYAAETEPLLAFYRERGLVLDIDGEQSEDDVFSAIVQAYAHHSSVQPGSIP